MTLGHLVDVEDLLGPRVPACVGRADAQARGAARLVGHPGRARRLLTADAVRTRPRLAAVPRDLDAVLDDRAVSTVSGIREAQAELGRPGLVVLVLESGIR